MVVTRATGTGIMNSAGGVTVNVKCLIAGIVPVEDKMDIDFFEAMEAVGLPVIIISDEEENQPCE